MDDARKYYLGRLEYQRIVAAISEQRVIEACFNRRRLQHEQLPSDHYRSPDYVVSAGVLAAGHECMKRD